MALREFLSSSCKELVYSVDHEKGQLFLSHLQDVLHSNNSCISQTAIYWTLESLIKEKTIPAFIQPEILKLIRQFKMPWLVFPLLEWLNDTENPYKNDILSWLTELEYTSAEERISVIEPLLNRYLSSAFNDSVLIETLKRLDILSGGEVTELLLYHFPAKTEDKNRRIIFMLGHTKRYRVVKPIITFGIEFPQYYRVIIKALSSFESEEVDHFLLHCLDLASEFDGMVLIEAVKQARKRRLKKAVPLLEKLFPVEENSNALINQSLNGEIALTMASFGAYCWAREKLLPEIMLSGITHKYLKAVDILNLVEAVPLLKAIILMPETPEILSLQHSAYHICERILIEQRA